MKIWYLPAGLVLCLCISAVTGAAVTVHPGESIQSAIDSAQAGDVVEVESGTYYEHLTIDKPLTLKGVDTGGGMPVIDGQGEDTVIMITSDYVVVDDLKVIRCDPTKEGRERGIAIHGTCCIVKNCEINECNIGLGCSSKWPNALVTNCVFTDDRIGLVMRGKHHVADGNSFNKAHIILDLAEECYVINNVIGDDPAGISVYDASNDNVIAGNTIKGNRYAAIWVVESEWGPTSHGNRIFHNNFIMPEGGFQAADDGGNAWDNGAEGNYWSDFTGTDANGDGIYDQPYSRIVGDDSGTRMSDSKDRYPLVSEWQGTETAPDFQGSCPAGGMPGGAGPTETNVPGFGLISVVALIVAMVYWRAKI